MADANDKKHFFACKEEDLSDNEMLKIDLPDQPLLLFTRLEAIFLRRITRALTERPAWPRARWMMISS